MKKFGKFIFGALSVAALAGGAIYYLKNFVKKDSSDDFDDFDDDFEDFDSDDEEEDKETDKSDTREYVTLNMTENDMDKAAAASAEAGFAVEEDKTTSETDFDIEYHEDVTEE
ncbi:hypothetical protein [Anaeromicropila herbilytica]|uniref:DUF4366 domain-containing protein n=1 Tax=Anaeromicropila herbilytica TaxID=2785025 RepID=A0A7R7EPB3_9FIRM|nr:hypothetical protein [Anaeromicropila herbilytica]BCN32503.1 hypothetical protein bsdtb5_37980 [Anaeromicropila herbilytica]